MLKVSEALYHWRYYRLLGGYGCGRGSRSRASVKVRNATIALRAAEVTAKKSQFLGELRLGLAAGEAGSLSTSSTFKVWPG